MITGHERVVSIADRIVRSLAFQVVAVVLLHREVFRLLFEHCQLPFKTYFEPYLATAALQTKAVLVLLLLPTLIVILSRRELSWKSIDPGRHTRWFIMVVAGVLAWTFSTYDTNLFFDQSHWLDRCLLVALWLALFLHPIAIFPFVVLLMVIATQGHYPLPEGQWMWPDKRLPLDILIVFSCYLVVASVLRRRLKPNLLPLLLLCIVGATYGHAAINKLTLGPSYLTWPLENQLSDLFVASHLNGGWLRDLSESTILELASIAGSIGIALTIGTIIAELAGLFILAHWKATRLILIGFVLLHLGILASSGIFFWKWIAVDLALLGYLSLLRRDAASSENASVKERPRVHARWAVVIGVTLIVLSPKYLRTVSFAWFDTTVTNYFEIHAIGESGEKYRIDPRYFAPYDIVVQQSRHYYAFRGPVLVGTYGTTLNWELATALRDATPETLPEIKRKFARVHTAPHLARVFFQFINSYIVNGEKRGSRRTALSFFAPPFHFQTTLPENHFDFQEPVTAIEVRFVEFLHTGTTVTKTFDAPAFRFDIKRSKEPSKD